MKFCFFRSFASAAASSTNYTSNLEKSLHQIDQDVRRMGRVSRKELEEVLEEIKQSSKFVYEMCID